MTRTDRVRAATAAAGADAALITSLHHIRWACGFSGSNAILLVTPQRAVLFTDGRYTTQAAQEAAGTDVRIASDLVADLADSGATFSGQSIVVDGGALTVDRYRAIEDGLDADLLVISGFLEREVAAKDELEIDAVRRAQAVTCDVFEAVVPLIAPGIRETELAAEIVYQHLRRGATGMAFEPIVAAGARAALPHARPSEQPMQRGDLVVIDMGGIVDGYCADMTRTVAIGTPDAEALAAHDAVEHAVQAALGTLRAGVSGADVDRAARESLDASGLADHFTHSTGHGVGMDVHEWPRLSAQVDHTIPDGACVTVEPGVYIAGQFGIRTEDLVVVRNSGVESLTRLSRGLVVV